MDLVKILILGLIFMALFPTLMNTFTTPTGNATPYPALYMTIFTIIPLLLVLGLLTKMWGNSGAGVKI